MCELNFWLFFAGATFLFFAIACTSAVLEARKERKKILESQLEVEKEKLKLLFVVETESIKRKVKENYLERELNLLLAINKEVINWVSVDRVRKESYDEIIAIKIEIAKLEAQGNGLKAEIIGNQTQEIERLNKIIFEFI